LENNIIRFCIETRSKTGTDIIQIGLPNFETYIFKKPFPRGLVTLLETDRIKKVASKIPQIEQSYAKLRLHLAKE